MSRNRKLTAERGARNRRWNFGVDENRVEWGGIMCEFSDSMESSANQCADLEHEADNLERYEQQDMGDVDDSGRFSGDIIEALTRMVEKAEKP